MDRTGLHQSLIGRSFRICDLNSVFRFCVQVLIHTQLPTGVGAGEVKQPGGVLPLEDALYALVRFKLHACIRHFKCYFT